jgi:hypothetical protein
MHMGISIDQVTARGILKIFKIEILTEEFQM